MNTESELLYGCIRESRCRLCQFDLQKGDSVIAFAFRDERHLSYFTFDTYDYRDTVLHVNFHICRAGCRFGDFVTPIFHKSCYEFIGKFGPVTTSLLAATEYSFQPSSYEKQQRLRRLKGTLCETLPKTLPLPPEIITMIADLLVHSYAAIITQTQTLQDGSAAESVVDLNDNIYAPHKYFDGVRYIQSLSNSGLETELVLKANEKGTVRRITVAEDHLGIRQVHNDRDTTYDNEETIHNAWWRDISRSDGIASIRTRTDGVKLRDIMETSQSNTFSGGSEAGPFSCVRWAHPKHPAEILDLDAGNCPQRFPSSLRMCYFDCNGPRTIGYSVATDGLKVSSIHAHRQDDDVSFYVDSGADWIYMPVEGGEYLTEIGVRYHQRKPLAILFTTNRGRRTLFGASSTTTLKFITVHKPSRKGSRIWFNAWDSVQERRLKYMAFEDGPLVERLPPSLLTPPVADLPHTQYNEPWFFSSCSLKDIVGVTVCRDTSLSHQPILGILLLHKGGHKTSLGRFRFDQAIKQVQVEECCCLHIGSRRTDEGFPYVADVTVYPQSECLSSIVLHSGDVLEWYFSNRHCIVRKAAGDN
ncbi:hypothetical protein CONLIGDRAFT_667147 [Coniochaeta ligniaria NRRL 30616]|uniref:Uncharacterized protein n=1 Tax=Coniochaeta ligniaria NRRL 30616 TaxID=1408157 RepID=A0A1J7JKL9_9PEZI|nr:hypothetical protein CONLIGDRAFT_667147 [Coniochaeta ligniaria NRRL 30616]